MPSNVRLILVPDHPDALRGALSKVHRAYAGRIPDSYRGEHPRAYVTLNEGADTTGEALTAWLNPQIGKVEQVDAVVVRDTMPKTMIGKLSRKDLVAEVLE